MPLTAPIEQPPQVPLGPVPPEEAPEVTPVETPTSILGDEVPPGAPIPPEKMHEAGKADFHAEMRDFGNKEAANRGSMLALDPNDPAYMTKLAAHQAAAGLIKSEKAHFAQMHPWGSEVSAHPGFGGKIGHVLGEVGNVAGEALAPRVAEAIPGSNLNLEGQVAEGEGQIADANKQSLEAAQAGDQNATASKAPSEIAKNTAEAGLQTEQEQKLTDAGPKLEEQYASAVEDAISAGRDPATDPKVQQIQDAITGIQKESKGTQKAPHVTYNQGVPVTVEDGQGNSFDVNDPNLPTQLKPIALRALASHSQRQAEDETKQQRTFAQREKMFALQQNALTSATKSMVEASPKVIELSERVKDIVTKDADNLGPLSSRWRELWAGKIGTEDKQFTKLRTDVGLLNTLLMRMHVGARGGVDIMHHFQDLLDAGKQDPGNMLAALEEIDNYAKDVQKQGESKGVHTEGSTPKQSTAPPQGATHTGRSNVDHKLYYLDAKGNKLGPAE